MCIVIDKEINRASLTIYISIDGKVSAPSVFFFLLINRIDSIIYTYTYTHQIDHDDVDFYHSIDVYNIVNIKLFICSNKR